MKTQKPTAVSDLLGKGQGLLQRLRQGASQAAAVLDAVRAELPPEPARHVLGASTRGTTLTLLVDSAAWGTRIRYEAPGLCAAVGRRLGTELTRAVVRVRPAG